MGPSECALGTNPRPPKSQGFYTHLHTMSNVFNGNFRNMYNVCISFQTVRGIAMRLKIGCSGTFAVCTEL